ncbi:hypothetical protein AYO38_03140 [bacterium SCGC AG-212-C10]|nr:hypothetical protein AYO38_03140 [bacterium SCGC AG-212-C10]
MKATELLTKQMTMVHNRIAGLANLTGEEWLARPAPGENRVGFTAWHMVATRDWVVRGILGGERPLGWDAPFAGTSIALCPIPLGMPGSEADAIAEAVSPAEVVAYSAAVTAELTRWLASADQDALDAPPSDGHAHLALSPRYNDRPFRFEVLEDPDDMCQWPVWQLLSRPAYVHCIGHLAEIDLARRALVR